MGAGSRFFFTVELPPARGEVRAEVAEEWSQVKSLAPGFAVKAMVADDVEENREVLRRLLEDDPSKPRYIQTVWGVGYVFVPD